VLALVVVAVASVAHADSSAPELQAKGEQLAKDGRFSEAIEAFKAADRLQPSAAHACLIALAYTRRELWPQAEIFLARCHERATPGDPLPDWVPVAEQQIQDRLATANAAPVTLDVSPPSAPVQLTVSSFAPDETFGPRTIHLPPGRHTVIAEAPGFQTAHVEIVVETKDPQKITIELVKPVVPRQNVLANEPILRGHPPERSPWGKRLMIGGAILAGAGAVTYGWMSYEWSQLRTQDQGQYTDHSSNYDTARIATISLWAAGGAALIGGYLLHRHDESASVAAVPLPGGGGMLSVGWTR
jgi:hypothetical protein